MNISPWFAIKDHGWQADALCRNADPELFFHPDWERGSARRLRQQRAREVCASCPVILRCRLFAIDGKEPYGTWGGLSEEDRRRRMR
ncbi:WhiB family transcriptional regulator [Mycobacteroides chelonae]|uniref:WhiB family transcriptional regulator n=1 Tax=Mycobacteroides chelonae TaxID=1774 RepID=UPI0009BF1426|nr:WhiB family transcriptional regulator [Mycobacteroides chelonae]QQG86644.1 WhiB family transcriptional regulator [Mycobacteroides chelonae]QQG91461.1 WhiB family transcriptional regulator [Mycobacteroides chelonae]